MAVAALAPGDPVAPLRTLLLGGAGFSVFPMPTRVLFGAGTLDRLPEVVDGLGARRVLVVASAGRTRLVERVAALLGSRVAGVDLRAAMHVPAALAEAVHADARRVEADLVVAVGGGSPIGMAKALALAGGPPCVAVPTTYSGSEMTPIWGVTREGAKETGRDERVRPRAVIYDPALTLDLPPRVAGPSALNAMAHCVEALYAPDASPLVALAAVEGLRALAASTPRLVHAPADLAARTEALYGSWLAGFALGASTMGLHHKLCHVLGGSFGLPHAETHAIVLPHTVAYNASAAPAAIEAAAGALSQGRGVAVGAGEVPQAIHALLADVAATAGAPASLGAIGFRKSDIERAAALAAARPYPNPRPVRADAVRALLARAYEGALPANGE
jgi:maleylacetate reductase